MNPMQEAVRQFHLANNAPAPDAIQTLPEERVDLRVGLIEEELSELKEAFDGDDFVEVVDACIDILYVTLGLLVEMGVNAQPVFDEVQRANLSKLGENGKPIISRGEELDGFPAGKVLKGPNYSPPDVRLELRNQGWTNE